VSANGESRHWVWLIGNLVPDRPLYAPKPTLDYYLAKWPLLTHSGHSSNSAYTNLNLRISQN